MRRIAGCVTIAVFLATSPATAQLRGTAVFLEPSYGYDWRAGIDVGYGGSGDEGFAIAATAAYQFTIGNCRRITASLGAGIFDPEEDDDDGSSATTPEIDGGANLGSSVWVLLNPCPDSLTEPRLLFWTYAGGGAFRGDDRTVWSSSVGLAFMVRFDDLPMGKLEPWIVPRLQHVQALRPAADDETELAFSTGVNIGLGGTAGLRIAWDCCMGGGGEWSWGFSLWI